MRARVFIYIRLARGVSRAAKLVGAGRKLQSAGRARRAAMGPARFVFVLWVSFALALALVFVYAASANSSDKEKDRNRDCYRDAPATIERKCVRIVARLVAGRVQPTLDLSPGLSRHFRCKVASRI